MNGVRVSTFTTLQCLELAQTTCACMHMRGSSPADLLRFENLRSECGEEVLVFPGSFDKCYRGVQSPKHEWSVEKKGEERKSLDYCGITFMKACLANL